MISYKQASRRARQIKRNHSLLPKGKTNQISTGAGVTQGV